MCQGTEQKLLEQGERGTAASKPGLEQCAGQTPSASRGKCCDLREFSQQNLNQNRAGVAQALQLEAVGHQWHSALHEAAFPLSSSDMNALS